MKKKRKTDWVSYRRNTRTYRQCRPGNNKKPTKFGMRLFNGKYLLSLPLKLQNLKYEHQDLTHS